MTTTAEKTALQADVLAIRTSWNAQIKDAINAQVKAGQLPELQPLVTALNLIRVPLLAWIAAVDAIVVSDPILKPPVPPILKPPVITPPAVTPPVVDPPPVVVPPVVTPPVIPPPIPDPAPATAFKIGLTAYAGLVDALAALRDGQNLDIPPGLHSGHAGRSNASGITIQCLVGEAIFDSLFEDKATFVLGGDAVTLTGLAGEGIVSGSGNGGLIRMEGTGHVAHDGELMTLNRIRLDRCQTGVLTNSSPPDRTIGVGNGIIRINNCSGTGNGDGTGQSHAMYLHHHWKLLVDGYDMRDSDTGHLLKTHADETYIKHGTFVKGRASFAIDVCRRSFLQVESSYFNGGQDVDNSVFIQYAGEATNYPPAPRAEVHIAADCVAFDTRSPLGLFLNLKQQPDIPADNKIQYNPAIPDPHASDASYEGSLDSASGGWLRDKNNDTPISAFVLVDSLPPQMILADTLRPDLVTAGKGSGKHGFTVPLSAGASHVVSAAFPDGRPLPGSPKTFTYRAPPTAGSSNPAWPAWRQRLPLWTPTPIPGTAPKNFGLTISKAQWDEYSAAIINPANGKAYHAAGGGHFVINGDQNGVAGSDFTKDSPAWAMLFQASGGRVTDAAGNLVSVTGGYFPDNRPVGSHLYGGEFYVRQVNGIVRLYPAEGGFEGGGTAGGDASRFDLTANDWDKKGTWPATPFGGPEMVAALDDRTGKIYFKVAGTWSTKVGCLDTVAKRFSVLADNGWGAERIGACVVPSLDAMLHDHNAASWADRVGKCLTGYRISQNDFIDYPDITWRAGEKPTSPLAGLFNCERLHCVFGVVGSTLYRINLADWTGLIVTDQLPTPTQFSIYKRIDDVPILDGILMIPGYDVDAVFIATD